MVVTSNQEKSYKKIWQKSTKTLTKSSGSFGLVISNFFYDHLARAGFQIKKKYSDTMVFHQKKSIFKSPLVTNVTMNGWIELRKKHDKNVVIKLKMVKMKIVCT